MKDTDTKILPSKLVYAPKLNGILFDCETDTINDELILRLGYYMRILNNKCVEENFFYNKDDFTKIILNNVGANGSRRSYVWAHNTGFDFRVGINPSIFKNADFSLSTVSTNPFIVAYSLPMKDIKGNDITNTIMFLDSFNFFKTSIEKLGNFFGVKKVQIDFDQYEKDNKRIPEKLLKDRCQNDVFVLYKLLLALYEQMPNRVKFSSAQLSYSTFKCHLPYAINKINTELASTSYHGGRVEVFKKDKANVIKYDVNSMYSNVMLKNSYPVELLKDSYLTNTSPQVIQRYLDDGYGCIADVTLNVPETEYIPFAPYLRPHDKKLIFPVGKFRTVLCNPELNIDHIEKIHKVEFYKMGKIFENFVNKYYPLKEKAVGFMREFYKVGILNSCYGKFGQKFVKTERFKQYDERMQYGQLSLENLDHKVSLLKFLDGQCFKNISYGRKNSVAIASFVCSYARYDLYNYLKLFAKHLYYCDTDCFVLPDNIKLPLSDKLGGLKIEAKGIAQFYTPKIYYFMKGKEKDMKLKGIPRTWEHKINDKEIFAQGTRFTNFSESINKYGFQVKRVKENKTVKLIDTKRIWDGDNSTPLILTA